MNYEQVLYPGLIIGGLGAFFAIVLGLVAKRFAVEKDERIEALNELLPGLNCGGCGFAGCSAYAEALSKDTEGELSVDMCKPGGEETLNAIASFLGRESAAGEPMVAKVMCRGGNENAKIEFEYEGVQSCRAAKLVKGGPKVCKNGCIGFGDCIKVCQFGAMSFDENGIPQIDPEKCVACGACVNICPRKIIQLIPKKQRVFVECRNVEKGPVTMRGCTVGCIACGLCVKECPVDAIHICDNVAEVDYEKCINCGKCAKRCPRKIIAVIPLSQKKST